ncbi:hypothetical protein EI94DRAFT_1704113 [Lactarius quietus]|nr:hypothetical protein EI94DRAFT_1704113 [Lactarius quietus]
MTHLLLTVLLLSLVRYGRAQQSLFPAAIPLAVRSPYLSGWDFTTNGTTIGQLWSTTSSHQPYSSTYPACPQHTSAHRVNGSVNLTNVVISPTQTKLTANAGPMQCNLTFLNPIEPGDWVKQSIPFSYLSLSVESLDGAAHAVQVYSDVSGQWLSGDRSQEIEWSTTSNNGIIYHMVELQNPAVFSEIDTQADWGTLYYAMKSVGKITFKIDIDASCRGSFQQNGTLDNQTYSIFGPIGPTNPVFAISRDLGTIQATQSPVVWAIGLTTNPAIQYQDPSTNAAQQRSLYYQTQYYADTSLIPDFLNDFANASSRAQQLDAKILRDAATVSSALGDLVSLATAQVYGSIQLTIGTDASGKLNKSDVMAFMKNIGGSNTNRVNAVETLYSAFPALMYIDPGLGGLLLEPLFRLQASPSYKIPYAATDLESGNMLIMTYAYARASGDGACGTNKTGQYPLLSSWADYLFNYTLYTTDETSADGLTANNQTNLAIKGIIALEAMSKMSAVVNLTANADKYSKMASSLYSQWKGLALASDQHLLATYGLADSWTLGYNLFADVWLGTSVVESSVYDGQSSFIDNVTLSSNFSNYGMPVDNYNTDTSTAVSSWTLFVAAMTSNQDLRTNLISRVHNRASYNATAGVFPVLYDSSSGLIDQGGARVPVLRISANPMTTGTSSQSQSNSNSKLQASAIAGGSLCDVTAPDWSRIVTPFNLTLVGETVLETGSQTNLQGRWSEPLRPESIPLAPASITSDSPVLSPLVVSHPVGLSSKGLARLRSDSLGSQPTALSSGPISPTTTELGATASSLETLILRSEVGHLRREVQQLRAERLQARPGYEAGGA